MKVNPQKGRSIISENLNTLKIEIPSKKNMFLILFLGFWLMGWAFGEITVICVIIFGPKAPHLFFLVAWLGGWSIGGFFAITTWLWHVFGKEIVLVNSNELIVKKPIPFYTKSKEYEISSISNLASIESFPNSRNKLNSPFISNKFGTVSFDYGLSTIKFGDSIDRPEAAHIAELINAKLCLS